MRTQSEYSNDSVVDIKNAALANPLSKYDARHMGQTRLNQNVNSQQYLDECYVEPDFAAWDSGEGFRASERFFKNLRRREAEEYDIPPESEYTNKIEVHHGKRIKEAFETDLLGLGSNPQNEHKTLSSIFMIQGPGGCGKSTYAHHLLNKGDFDFDLCDMEIAGANACHFLSGYYDFPADRPTPIYVIERQLMTKIHKRLRKKSGEDEQAYKNRLDCMYQQYRLYILDESDDGDGDTDDKDFRNFFAIIREFCMNKFDYEQFGESVLETIKAKIAQNDFGESAIIYLVGILIRIYFCLTMAGDTKKHILFLDNIERFIMTEAGTPYAVFYDHDLQTIFSSIYAIAERTADLIRSVFRHRDGYKTSFGILIAMRDSSRHIIQSYDKHNADREEPYVDLSFWFDYEKIFNRKLEYFLDYPQFAPDFSHKATRDRDFLPQNTFVEALRNIMKDISPSRWALRKLLLNMFNNNYRRFFESILDAFGEHPEQVKQYNIMWKRVVGVNSDEAGAIRHLCRKLILRVILDYFQNVGKNIFDGFSQPIPYFDRLMCRYPTDSYVSQIVAKSSYARRFLTYLDNVKKGRLNPSRQTPYDYDSGWRDNSLLALLIILLKKGSSEGNEHKFYLSMVSNERIGNEINASIRALAQALTIASLIKMGDIHSVPLVNFNIDRDQIPDGNLAEYLSTIWTSYLDYLGNKNSINLELLSKKQNVCSVRITPAGSAFALYCAEFEYFTCRYMNQFPPLFSIKSEEDRRELIFGTLREEDLLNEVIPPSFDLSSKNWGIYHRAIHCAELVLQYETDFLEKVPGKKIGSNYSKPDWIYRYDEVGDGMVHPLRIFLSHIGFLESYKVFLGSNIASSEWDNEHYIKKDGKGIIDIAIREYYKKMWTFVENNASYVNLGYVPKICYRPIDEHQK